MTDLFTEDDVAELRRLGWFNNRREVEKLGDRFLDDDQLLMDLIHIDEYHQNMIKEYGNVGAGKYTGLMQDVRAGAKDAVKLMRAFDSFSDRHDVVISLYDGDGELSTLRTAITKMTDTTELLKSRVGSRHDPSWNPLKRSANQLIDLWTAVAGSPPKFAYANRRYTSGKCLFYVLDKLCATYGGELTDKTLAELCRKATTKYNQKKRDQKKK
jgi:hypothetical protein